jgi:hypothetical protein
MYVEYTCEPYVCVIGMRVRTSMTPSGSIEEVAWLHKECVDEVSAARRKAAQKFWWRPMFSATHMAHAQKTGGQRTRQTWLQAGGASWGEVG